MAMPLKKITFFAAFLIYYMVLLTDPWRINKVWPCPLAMYLVIPAWIIVHTIHSTRWPIKHRYEEGFTCNTRVKLNITSSVYTLYL